MNEPKRIMYSVNEVAAMIGRDRTTIWRWANKGFLQRVRIPGGRPMISAASLEKFLRANS